MPKKILCILLALLFAGSSALAATTAQISDVENDIITVNSTAFAGESVSIMITNPGFTKAQALAGSDGAIQYFNSFVPKSLSFSIPVKIMGNAGGDFKVYILSRDGEQTADFTFYNSVFKAKCINDINIASAGSDITPYFENLVNAYGLSAETSYVSLGSKAVADAFLLLRDTKPGKLVPNDVGEVMEMIEDSFVLAAFNTGRAEFCFSGNTLLNADILSVQSSAELLDYNTSLTAAGVTYIKQKLMQGGYKKIEDITDKFKELVHRGVLLNYKEQGYGHIHGYFTKYRAAYENAGFVIPANENRSRYTKLLSLTDESLSSLASKFNNLKEETNTPVTNIPGLNPSPGNNTSVGGSFSTGGGTAYVDPNPAPVNPPVQSGASFSDVPSDHWALQSVELLKEKGWITGYENGEFRPDNFITRAEFTKLILTVFAIKEGGEAAFSDVSENAWYAPFVAIAQANGIINGTDGYFFPENNLTRQDAAVIICRILDKISKDTLTFTDLNDIAEYALPSVSYLASIGIINGYTDNSFKPNGNITRAEISKIICTLYEKGGIQ